MDKVEIRITLEGEEAQKFLKLKAKYGVKKYAELVRILIEQEYQRKMGQ